MRVQGAPGVLRGKFPPAGAGRPGAGQILEVPGPVSDRTRRRRNRGRGLRAEAPGSGPRRARWPGLNLDGSPAGRVTID
eukprot:767213-Hanusia_phi.AAC.1